MNKILKLLSSIKFWTILGVIASTTVLIFTFYQEDYKNKVELSIFGMTVPNQFDGNLIILNSVSIPEEVSDGITVAVPFNFDFANTSDKSISNVYLKLKFPREQGIRMGNVNYAPLYWASSIDGANPLYTELYESRKVVPPNTTMLNNNSFNDSLTSNILYPAVAIANINDMYVFQGELNIRGDKCKTNKYKLTILTYWNTYIEEPELLSSYDKNSLKSIKSTLEKYGQHIRNQIDSNDSIAYAKAIDYLKAHGYGESTMILIPMSLGPLHRSTTIIEGTLFGNITPYPELIKPLIYKP